MAMSDDMGSFLETSTDPEQEWFGWMTPSVKETSRHSQSVNMMDGHYTTVSTKKTFQYHATALQ